eukprot:TRINITY_DN408_c0_g1_i1.p1 TRINITY_DN408_c0_g1~~TRINITY_DN408_c0_g1_i1.p1  ORF type:complete len:432 (-),score=75.67 TRINITY_DN408_c0_g1_i1:20-1231(-)
MATKDTKLYDLLGVPPTASPADLTKAYKQKARQYHPDRNLNSPDAEEKFKEIKNAYEILADAEKRQLYDRFGEEGLKEGGPGGRGGGFDLFSELFGMRQGGGGRQRRGEDLVHRLAVTLEDLYNSKETKLALRKNVVCAECEGKGSSKPGAVSNCADCRGQGVKVTLRQVGPGMVQQLQMECSKCSGRGEIIREKDRCKKCGGEKVVQEKKILDVYIEKGMSHKQKLTFSGEGDQEPGVIPGDVVVLLVQEQHSVFTRDGGDLIIEKEITLYEALCGFSFVVKHLDGRVLLVKSKPGEIIKPGDVKEIPNEGMPTHRQPFDKGVLVIKFSIQFPSSISAEHASTLANVLPQPAPLGALKMEEVEEVSLQEYGTSRSSQHGGGRREAYEEDEAGGQPGIGCAQQ